MDETNLTKGELWKKRIQDFYKSGLSRKEWCQEHQVPLSTLGYWIRKQTQKPSEPDPDLEPVFAKLPSEPEIFSGKQPGSAPVTISLPGNVRIEVSAFCPGELMATLIHTIRAYA